MRNTWIFLFLFVLFSGTAYAAPQSLADHEKLAPTLSFSDAYKAQKKLTLDGEIYNVVPYAKRTYSIIKGKKHQEPKYRKTFSILAYEYGNALALTGKSREAVSVLKEALEVYEVLYGRSAMDLIDPLMALGNANLKYKGRRTNNEYYDRALEIARLSEGDNSPLVGKLYFEISQSSLVLDSGNSNSSIRTMEKAHKILVKELGEDHRDTAVSAYRLGELAVRAKKYTKAASYLERAVSIFDAESPNSRLTQRMHELLVKTYEKSGKREYATKHSQMIGRIKEFNKDPQEEGEAYKPIHREFPRYPRIAQQKRKEGQVVVELTVARDGTPHDIRVLESRGDDSFEKASIKAASKFRYAPRYSEGEPVETKGVRYRFTFTLSN